MDFVVKLFLILGLSVCDTLAFIKPTCSKDYLRYMVSSACSYAKREVSKDDLMKIVEEEFNKNFKHVENEEYEDNEIFHAPLNYRNHKLWRELLLKPSKNKRITDKFENVESDWQNLLTPDDSGFGRYKEKFRRSLGLESASMPLDDITGIPVPWMNGEELPSKGIDGSLLYRDIRDIVMKCCMTHCTVDEFKHICG